MQFRILRRWLAVCVVAALTLGQAAQAFAASSMDAKMLTAVTSGEMAPMAAGCDGCGGGDDAMPATGCYALCGGAVAILPSVNAPKVVAARQPAVVVVPAESGRDSRPDPYPPRRTIPS